MGTTVIVVDTNIIRDSPGLDSNTWIELIAKVDEWDLRFAIPAAVEVEAVAVVRRMWVDERAAVAKLKVARESDVAEEHQRMLSAIDGKIDGYAQNLRNRLAEIGAEVVPTPDWVDVLEITERAAARRAPYTGERKMVSGTR